MCACVRVFVRVACFEGNQKKTTPTVEGPLETSSDVDCVTKEFAGRTENVAIEAGSRISTCVFPFQGVFLVTFAFFDQQRLFGLSLAQRNDEM